MVILSCNMRQFLFIPILTVLFCSCVSKKKFDVVKSQLTQVSEEKTSLEETLGKLAMENDSLKKDNILLDSLYRTEREKSLLVSNKKENKDTKTKKKNTLTKAQEYDKKALFMYNFTSYVSWPSLKSNKFLIGIVGDSPITFYLTAYTKGKTHAGLPIVVEPYKAGFNYQIVFISALGIKDFSKVKKEVQGKQVLLVSDNVILDKIGSHISFDVDGEKVNFNVNKDAIQSAGMNVNSKLINFSQN